MFVNTLVELADFDRSIILITGDLGFNVLNNFWEKYPNQFINAGISEQNMTSVAAGLAISGKIVFTYSIANFPTFRCLEQIRNDIAYHNANVKVVSVGAGFAYGSMGMSHHATEDLAIMRAIPNIRIYSPSDLYEVKAAVIDSYNHDGPCYIRLGKGGEKIIHTCQLENPIRSYYQIYDGRDLCIIATGSIISEAESAILNLHNEGLSIALISWPIIKPMIKHEIIKIAKKYKYIITLEEHNIIGGLGSAISEIISDEPDMPLIFKMGINDTFISDVGSQKYLRKISKISSSDIEDNIRKILDRSRV